VGEGRSVIPPEPKKKKNEKENNITEIFVDVDNTQ